MPAVPIARAATGPARACITSLIWNTEEEGDLYQRDGVHMKRDSNGSLTYLSGGTQSGASACDQREYQSSDQDPRLLMDPL